jgi:hypothetical protein
VCGGGRHGSGDDRGRRRRAAWAQRATLRGRSRWDGPSPGLVSHGGVARCRSHAPGPPSLRAAKPRYARASRARSRGKLKVATDRTRQGLEDRGRVRVVATVFDPSPYSYQGLEPASARLGAPDRLCSITEEQP